MSARSMLPEVDESRCNLCGLCVEACACRAVQLGEKGPVFVAPERCLRQTECSADADCACLCEEVCPTGAISCSFEIVAETGKDE